MYQHAVALAASSDERAESLNNYAVACYELYRTAQALALVEEALRTKVLAYINVLLVVWRTAWPVSLRYCDTS